MPTAPILSISSTTFFIYNNKTMKSIPRSASPASDHASRLPLAHASEQPSPEAPWKKNVVLLAKNVNVWLAQLSGKYRQKIVHLDHIPAVELEKLAAWGITALWLVGVWERSPASRKIKELYGREDIAASAYSIKEYRIARSLGGEPAADALHAACDRAGIRLCVDIVPNHTGIDSDWLLEHPEWYISVSENPAASFHFNSPDLSPTPNISLQLEEGYYDQSAAAEVFLYTDHRTGEKRFIYHGNDGSSMPWNDTAQLDYLNAEVREHVIETILCILKRFPLIRFDAAMTLTRQHFQRLWYPLPGSQERCVPTRERHALPAEAFLKAKPREFWREVVERVERENPDALLMAEAFWYMENFFVEELGMHRVYNIAFMQSLRDEDNKTYQSILKNALASNPLLLGKFVNFLSNPDERTALDQFGKGDKYFAACTLLITMPGIPMFNHGQIEGFSERYGMDFLLPLLHEKEDADLLRLHERWIFPLLRMRPCFSDAASFCLFDVVGQAQRSLPHIYAYLNHYHDRYFLVLVNNSSRNQAIRFRRTVPLRGTSGKPAVFTLLEWLPRSADPQANLRCREVRTGEEWSFAYQDLEETGISLKLKPYQHFVWELFWSEPPLHSAPSSR